MPSEASTIFSTTLAGRAKIYSPLDNLFGKLLALCLTFFTPPSFTANIVGSANINIVSGIIIIEESQIDFGRITNANGICTMSPGGSLSGTAALGCNGVAIPASFAISGTDGAAVDIFVSGGNTIDGVKFDPVVSGSSTRFLSSNSTTVEVIGRLTLNNASEGIKDIPYLFTANYQ